MGKMETTWALMKASWQILRKDPELLALPVISAICCLSVMTLFILQGLGHGWLKALAEQSHAGQHDQVAYGFISLFYYCNFLIVIFFNAAIISCAVIRMEGGDPTIGDGLQAAVNRFAQIAGWALIAATVGFLLGMAESGSRRSRGIITGILGLAWSVVSYLAIPLIVIEKTSPLFALDRSYELMRKTWGEQVIGNFSFGLIYTILCLPLFPIILVLNRLWGNASFVPCVIVAGVYLVLLGIVQSALQAIFNAVIFQFARNGTAPDSFSKALLLESMRKG